MTQVGDNPRSRRVLSLKLHPRRLAVTLMPFTLIESEAESRASREVKLVMPSARNHISIPWGLMVIRQRYRLQKLELLQNFTGLITQVLVWNSLGPRHVWPDLAAFIRVSNQEAAKLTWFVEIKRVIYPSWHSKVVPPSCSSELLATRRWPVSIQKTDAPL